MPRQDRSGTKYEKLIALSLEDIGYTRDLNPLQSLAMRRI